ncbi:MAG: NADH-quinone oxidoreductase subunit J [Gemmatimonadetes bacterium]|nr:MAG: NADH-quinone oxidoreductase subunit J [Gemmatimonadota bacterium]
MVEFLFIVFAVVAVGSAAGVVLARSPVGSLLFMVASLASVAALYVLLEAHFLAAIQVMVYAGAIMVLFLFVIMLLNLGHDYRRDLRLTLTALPLFALTGGIAALLILRFRGAEQAPIYRFFGGGDAIDAALAEQGAVGAIAHPLFTDYLVPFEITGILLLVAIVGAMALAKRHVDDPVPAPAPPAEPLAALDASAEEG